MTKFPLVRILLVGVAIGAVATAAVIAADRSAGTTPTAQVAATTPVTAARNTNVGGDRDQFCNAHADYIVAINLLTFTSL